MRRILRQTYLCDARLEHEERALPAGARANADAATQNGRPAERVRAK